MSIGEVVLDQLTKVVGEDFENHPFTYGVTKDNFELLISNYLAMSLAFPYLQAGVQYRLIANCIQQNRDVPRDVEITAAVGAFLTWDEVGGHAIVQKYGNNGLPMILDTERFHANLLRGDIRAILGKELGPEFSPPTGEYLKRLEYGLSSLDPVIRVSHMVAFEKHAGRMIDALWSSIVNLYGLEKDSLSYFQTHVGGDDPAEEYHIQMTERMIKETILEHDVYRLFDYFKDAYALSFNWCEKIKNIG